MNKNLKYLILGSALLVSSFVFVFAQTNRRAATPKLTWETSLLNAKTEASTKLRAKGMPVLSEVVKSKQAVQTVKADITGWGELVLLSWGTTDGTNNDFGVWLNPKLTAADGSVVWLDELTPTYNTSLPAPKQTNKNLRNQDISVNGLTYEHAIFQHANGEMAFNLGKKYVSFEAEVGIDASANARASIIFGIQNISGKAIADKLGKTYPDNMAQLSKALPMPVELWLTWTNDADLKFFAQREINKLDNKEYFNSHIASLESIEPIARSLEYVKVARDINAIMELQPQLQWVNLDAMRMSLDDMKKNPEFDATKYEAKYKELTDGYQDALNLLYSNKVDGIAKANKILDLKREIMLANPLLDFDKIVVTQYDLGGRDRTAMGQNLGMPNANYVSMYSAARRNVKAEIVELSNIRGGAGKVEKRTIYKPESNVNISDLQMNWDGERLLFASVNDRNKWQVYEVNRDGSNFHQVIDLDEPDLEFCDANYLPDGRVMASTNMGYHGVPCVNGTDVVGNLSLYDPKTGDFRRLTFDQDGNWNPVTMNNGRVMYTRWEYTDLTHYFSRIVMHMNPDGTENKSLYGSGSFFPNSTYDMKPLPGSASKFIGVISGHHGTARSGRLMIFDPAKSRKEEKGMVQEIPFRDRKIVPIIKDYLVDGVWPQFIRPYPLNDEYFLVAAKLNPQSLWGIYLVDVFDNMTLISEFEGHGLNMPLAVRQTKKPPIIPDRIKPEDKEATVFIQDIYEGEGTVGVPRGTIKALRVFTYEYAYISDVVVNPKRISASDHDAMGVQSGWDIKRLLGVVPVEEDGSATFKIPANRPISLQPLDENGAAIQWFRSWFTAMPGETVSCIGCHEDQNQIPIPKRVTASLRKPHQLTPPEGGTRPFTFELEIQPILDRACIACHNGDNPNMPNYMSGRFDTMTRGVVTPKTLLWSNSYLDLHPYVYRQGPEADMYVLKPYEYHASNSELIRILKKGHHNVELTDKEWTTFYNWIDFNAPYTGYFPSIDSLKGYDQYERRMELMQKYVGIKTDWRQELKDYASYLKDKGDITPVMPKEVKEKRAKKESVKGWPMSVEQAETKQTTDNKQPFEVDVAPGIKLKFVWIPAGSFVMGSEDGDLDNRPKFATKVAKGFWMSECEITNEQFNAFFPEHDSRVIGQQWKDHTTAGYPANKPLQPAIRISWDEAMEFGKLLGDKLDKKVTLPTETQWEWACRAGSNSPMWYGEFDGDFGKLENMADTTLTNMAVTGVDPRPMPKEYYLRQWWDYLPKTTLVNDGEMIMTEVGKYLPNPWGLKDMHGNVAEWTRSDYLPYPIKQGATSDKKVVRGGSWTDRPQYSTSYTRKIFLPWQRPYNVGFRVVIEE